MRNSIFFVHPFSMLLGIAASKKNSIFYYCYNEQNFRVKGRRADESLKIVEGIADSLNLELRLTNPIPAYVEFQKDDLVDPFLLGSKISPNGKTKPDLIGWNADLYLKFSNFIRLDHPFKSYKVIKAWKEAECFKYYSDLVLHPGVSSNSLPINNIKIIEKEAWNLLTKNLIFDKSFHELFFHKFDQGELTLILLPHPTSISINHVICELANELIASQNIKKVIIKEHPNVYSSQTNLFNFNELINTKVDFFEPKEMPAEILVNFFDQNFTLGVVSGAHVQNSPEKAFILDSKIDEGSKLWSLYYSEFYSLTGHKIESKAQILNRIRHFN